MGDLEWLKEIFDNLISNAVKFSPCQSVIAVSAVAGKRRCRWPSATRGPG